MLFKLNSKETEDGTQIGRRRWRRHIYNGRATTGPLASLGFRPVTSLVHCVVTALTATVEYADAAKALNTKLGRFSHSPPSCPRLYGSVP